MSTVARLNGRQVQGGGRGIEQPAQRRARARNAGAAAATSRAAACQAARSAAQPATAHAGPPAPGVGWPIGEHGVGPAHALGASVSGEREGTACVRAHLALGKAKVTTS